MSDKGYTKHRGTDTGLEMKAVRAVLKVARSLPAGALRAVYPELAAASQAVRRLRNDQLPEQFARIDRIVVDELQDLTVLETAVIVQLCRAIARRRGWAPKLLMAGDAGQTVRPTAFKWAHVSNLLRSELRAPASFYLDEHVRCPKDIAEIVDRSAHLYTGVNKDVRPTKQHKQSGGEHVDAQLIHVQLTDPADIEPLLARLADSDNVAIVATSDTRPAWVPPQWRQSVLTPAQAKGLEYQAVCVLDPGANMATLRDDMFTREGDDIDQELHRAAIDDLRVTLSRATESLIFIDMQPDATALEASVRMLGNAAPYSPRTSSSTSNAGTRRPRKACSCGREKQPHCWIRRRCAPGSGRRKPCGCSATRTCPTAYKIRQSARPPGTPSWRPRRGCSSRQERPASRPTRSAAHLRSPLPRRRNEEPRRNSKGGHRQDRPHRVADHPPAGGMAKPARKNRTRCC